jgi:DNA-binding NtrC family response regulator
MRRNRILIVDDDAGIRFGVSDYLESSGYEVVEADSCAAAQEAFRASRPDVALLDLNLPDGTALDLLPLLKRLYPDVPLVILTGHGSIDVAVKAIKQGAEHFLTKPVELGTLLVILERLMEQDRNRQKQRADKSRQGPGSVDPFRGTSAVIRALAEQANKVLASHSPVLIQGETGTGKGVLARWLHANGPRAEEPFVDLNCAGLSREFLETELFGHEKGAFTGAVSSKIGLLEVAHRGTVFLDEIGDVDPQVQPKLLKVLEEKRFRRLGETRDRATDIRLIAATHHDLMTLVEEKRFRSDLYYRISALPLFVPPLRARVEDIPALAQAILESVAAEIGRRHVALLPEAIRALQVYSWPGNIRELRNVLERAVLLNDKTRLGVEELRFDRRTVVFPTSASGPAPPLAVDASRAVSGEASGEASGQSSGEASGKGVGEGSIDQQLSDLQWASIESLFPGNRRRGGQWKDHRQAFEGILWVLRGPASWREAPARFGPWQTLYDRFTRWSRDGTLDRALERLHLGLDRTGPRPRVVEQRPL